ncbi:MAG TPA: hypothetical protein DDZ40_07620 [Deltaproteobacteria bacterium]|nr:hypothetical protein [Deltaproteobacteria bacterium]
MTNKMKLVFLITTTISAMLAVLGTTFAGDIYGHALSVITQLFSPHEAPAPLTLAVLLISTGLYFVFRQARHS